VHKYAFFADHMEIPCGSIKWNVSFVGAAHDWEVNIFASFFRVLYLGKVRLESEDGGLAVVGAFQ
jgi:hypothetical protein